MSDARAKLTRAIADLVDMIGIERTRELVAAARARSAVSGDSLLQSLSDEVVGLDKDLESEVEAICRKYRG